MYYLTEQNGLTAVRLAIGPTLRVLRPPSSEAVMVLNWTSTLKEP